MLGTTETHICAFWEVRPLPEGMTEPIPVGRACSHVNLFALSPAGHIVPDGETGELAVRGPSLMEGYWQLPERTAQAMVDVRISGDLVARCYRTGDLVRKDREGNFHIIGRANRRIKVQGNLVDLDEVETVLLSEPRVRETAAFEVEVDGSSHVEAAVVPKPDAAPVTAAELRVHVARALPGYAVPERVTVVEDLPRTGSGKLSRRDLQDRAEAAARTEAAARATGSPAAGHPAATDEVMAAVRRFIVEELQAGTGAELTEEDDLLEAQGIGSIGVMRLVDCLEQQLAIRIPNHEFVAANFQRMKAIRALIERLH
jgi:acyl-coenzyme A synthetase/AMP-(fatty) acid ligase/acyl carrier protein